MSTTCCETPELGCTGPLPGGLRPVVRRSSAWVCFDGKQRQELLCGDSVRVRMSPNPVPTIDHLEQTSDWIDSLEVGRLLCARRLGCLAEGRCGTACRQGAARWKECMHLAGPTC